MAKVRIKYEVDDKQVKQLETLLKDIKGQTDDINEEGIDLEPKVKKSVGALSTLKNQIAGLGIAAAVGAGVVAFAKLTEEVNKNRKETAKLTGETGKALDNITAKVRATSDVFGKEYNEVLIAANTVSKNLGIEMTAAMDGINDAMAKGLDINGEYLDTIKEYSPFMKQAGIDFNQFNALIQKQVQTGVFSDKGIDAIKEAVISIQEMTPATEDALKAVGLNTDQITKDLASGATTYFEVIQQVGKELENVTNPRVRGQVLADIFRGAGEDAGDFALTTHLVNENMAELTGLAKETEDAQRRLLEANEDLNRELVDFSSNFSSATSNLRTFTTIIGTESLRALNGFLGILIPINTQLSNFKEDIQSLEISQIEKEIAELSEAPSFFERFGSAIFGVGQAAEAAATQASKVAILKDRLAELKKESNEEVAQTVKNTEAKIVNAKAAEETEKKLNAEAAARQKNYQALTNENEAFATRQRVLGEAGDEDNRIGEQDDFIAGIDARIRARASENAEAEAMFNADKRREQERLELADQTVTAMLDIYNQFSQLRIQQIDQQINANELARNRELEMAEGNVEKQKEINEKYDREQRALRLKQFKEEQRSALLGIIIETAKGVAKAVALSPATFGLPFSAFVAATGAAQAAIVLSQAPQFAKGTLDVAGSGNRDTVHAMLTPHEAVIPVRENRDYHPTLEAIYNRSIDPDILNQIALNGGHIPHITVNDYDKLAQAVREQPQKNVIVDSHGFTGHIISRYNHNILKQARFKM